MSRYDIHIRDRISNSGRYIAVCGVKELSYPKTQFIVPWEVKEYILNGNNKQGKLCKDCLDENDPIHMMYLMNIVDL